MTVAEFLVRLHAIDRRGLTARDALLTYYFMAHPGANGADACHALNVKHRSSIQRCLERLFAAGLLEDRRTEKAKNMTGRLYVTPAGVEFWEEIKP